MATFKLECRRCGHPNTITLVAEGYAMPPRAEAAVAWWSRVLHEGTLLGQPWPWRTWVRNDLLVGDFAKSSGSDMDRATFTALGVFFRGVMPHGWPRKGQQRISGARVGVTNFPPLEDCRAAFAAKYAHLGPFDWTAAP